jgi:hypothetical protein
MDLFRRIIVGIACGLLPVLFFIFGISFSLLQVFGTPDSLKHALAGSGIYDTAAANFVANAQTEGSNTAGLENLPAQQKDIQDIFQQSLPASFLQPRVESAIDNIYDWIHGDSARLSISIDLGENKEDLLARLKQYVQSRAANLPVCPPDTPIPADFDAFRATCRPAVVTPEMAADQAEAKLRQSDFFKESSVNTDTITDSEGRSLNDRFSNVPGLYNAVVKTIIIIGCVALALILVAIFVSRPWRDGLRRVSKIGLSIGIATTILAIASVFVTGKLADLVANSAGSTASFQASIADVVHALASDVRAWWLGYGITLIILAIAAFLALRVLSEKNTIDRNNAKPPEERPTVVVN